MGIEDEHHAMDGVVERIATRYPSLSRELIRDQVELQLVAFDGSTVRDFVPILVERDTVTFLAEFAVGDLATPVDLGERPEDASPMPIENERHAIAEVVERLSARHPDIPEAEIRAHVDEQLAKYSEAVVRDFVPVLVEHDAGEKLARQQVSDDA